MSMPGSDLSHPARVTRPSKRSACITDSVETVMHAERFDGLVTLAGCDKSLPGMLMAAARLNLPSVFLYGGSILPGRIPGDPAGRALDIVSVFEAVGARA